MGIGFNAYAFAQQMLQSEDVTKGLQKLMEGGVPQVKVDLKAHKKKNYLLTSHVLTDYEKLWWEDNLKVPAEMLEFFNVFGLQGYYRDGTKIWESRLDCPAYHYLQYRKAYRPTAPKGRKHRGIDNGDIMEGWHQLPDCGDHFILNTSFKDVITCRVLGAVGAASPSENSIAPLLKRAREIKGRFRRCFVLGDNDRPGRLAAERVQKLLNFEPIYMPWHKDPSDSVQMSGHYEYLNSIIAPLGLSKYHY